MSENGFRTIFSVEKNYDGRLRVITEFNQPFKVAVGAKEKRVLTALPIVGKIVSKRAEKRAKAEVRDIVLMTDFQHFCTFTLDPKKFPRRYDITMCQMAMHRWLEGQRKKYGRFAYIIVAEFHKDGAIHFHALFAGYKGPLTDSGVKHDNKPVYNLPAWRYGFSTAKVIAQTPDDHAKVAGYLTKYLTKDMPVFAGKRRYWPSKGLPRPERIVNGFGLAERQHILCDTNTKAWHNDVCTVYTVKPDPHVAAPAPVLADSTNPH